MLLQNADRVFAGLLGVAMGRRLQHGKVPGIVVVVAVAAVSGDVDLAVFALLPER